MYVGKTESEVRPVTAVLAYLARRDATPTPLCLCTDGSPLSRERLVTQPREALSACGVSPDLYSGHSFRKGAATAVACRGLEDSTIQTLGR